MEDTSTNLIRFQLLSDLHVEFTNVLEKMPTIEAKCDTLALIGNRYYCDPFRNNFKGDIGNPISQNKAYSILLEAQSKQFKNVLVVAGNHEFYANEYFTAKQNINEVCENFPNVVSKLQQLFSQSDIISRHIWIVKSFR